MNLLQLLLSSMLSDNSVNSVAKKTGLSSKLIQKIILAAVPILIRYMTQNASSQSGAQSLLGALTQHNNTRSIAEQIEEVDEEDGGKIIGHILGSDKEKVVKGLATETGAQEQEITRALGSIAPALLAALSAATIAANKKKKEQQQAAAQAAQLQTVDLSSLMQMFAGQQAQQQPQTISTMDVLGSLLGGQQAQQQPTGLGSLLGGLVGQQPVQQQQSAFDGSDLLNVLAALMK